MNTLEVLTLVLVIFSALAYIDNHRDKKYISYKISFIFICNRIGFFMFRYPSCMLK